MLTNALTAQNLLGTVRSVVEQGLRANIKERKKLNMLNPTTMPEQLHKLKHLLEQENHLLRMISLTLSDYRRVQEKLSEQRFSAFQELASSGKSANDQQADQPATGGCSQCGAEVEQIGYSND